MSTQQKLVHEITDIAMTLTLSHVAIVLVEYSSVANHICVSVRTAFHHEPSLYECIELAMLTDSDFTQRRAENRLRELIEKLKRISQLSQTPPPVAA